MALTGAALTEAHRRQLVALAGRIGRYDGLAFILGGAGLGILAIVRFALGTLQPALGTSASQALADLGRRLPTPAEGARRLRSAAMRNMLRTVQRDR